MKIECAYNELLPTESLVPNPKNPNQHTSEQIALLAKILKYQGWRNPIVISNRTGFVVTGHARLLAAKLNEWKEVPVDRQKFENEAAEYAHMVADNTIHELSSTDKGMVNLEIGDLGPDFDVDLLGIPDFKIEPMDIESLPDIGDGSESAIIQKTFTLSSEQGDIVDQAVSIAIKEGFEKDELNENRNGSALAFICSQYIFSKGSSS